MQLNWPLVNLCIVRLVVCGSFFLALREYVHACVCVCVTRAQIYAPYQTVITIIV